MSKVQLVSWDPVYQYNYEIKGQTTCHICKNDLHEQCHFHGSLVCQVPCNVSLGSCNHYFHEHCINRWLCQNKSCPIDNLPFKFAHKNICAVNDFATYVKSQSR